MAQKSGFYPSNEELGIIREYSGYEFGKVLNHVISDGVFATQEGTPSNYLQVVASTGLAVNVLPGAGRFAGQWYENDENITFVIDGESSLNRIDLIVIEANKSPNVLDTYAKVIKGTPAVVPVAPDVASSDVVKQYPLAKIYVKGGVPTITQSSIEDLRGIAPTLWVTGLIQQLDTSALWTQYNAAFWEWFDNVKDTLATSTLMRKYTGSTYSVAANQTAFEVPIAQYNSVLDILQVHIEGRILREGVDYVKNGTTAITLKTGLPVVNTLVYFEIFKSVDGSDAESIASLVYALEDRVAAMTQSNILYNSTGNIMGTNASVIPSKKLLECRNGWVLHFAKLGSTNNANFHYHIPKVLHDGGMWDGEDIIIDMVADLNTSGVATRVTKKLLIYNDRIRGFSGNDSTMALVSITEY